MRKSETVEQYMRFFKPVISEKKYKKYLKGLYNFDKGTFFHCVRVSYYSYLIGRDMDLSNEKMKDLVVGAFFHDIGKIAISKRIVLKNGNLTDEESQIMRRHADYGYIIAGHAVDANNKPVFTEKVLKIIRFHHEKYDGTGYPNELKGKEIGLITQIVHFADIYDALRSVRSYKEAFSVQKTSQIIKVAGKSECSVKVLKSAKNIGLLL